MAKPSPRMPTRMLREQVEQKQRDASRSPQAAGLRLYPYDLEIPKGWRVKGSLFEKGLAGAENLQPFSFSKAEINQEASDLIYQMALRVPGFEPAKQTLHTLKRQLDLLYLAEQRGRAGQSFGQALKEAGQGLGSIVREIRQAPGGKLERMVRGSLKAREQMLHQMAQQKYTQAEIDHILEQDLLRDSKGQKPASIPHAIKRLEYQFDTVAAWPLTQALPQPSFRLGPPDRARQQQREIDAEATAEKAYQEHLAAEKKRFAGREKRDKRLAYEHAERYANATKIAHRINERIEGMTNPGAWTQAEVVEPSGNKTNARMTQRAQRVKQAIETSIAETAWEVQQREPAAWGKRYAAPGCERTARLAEALRSTQIGSREEKRLNRPGGRQEVDKWQIYLIDRAIARGGYSPAQKAAIEQALQINLVDLNGGELVKTEAFRKTLQIAAELSYLASDLGRHLNLQIIPKNQEELFYHYTRLQKAAAILADQIERSMVPEILR